MYDKASDVDTLDRRGDDRKTWRHNLRNCPGHWIWNQRRLNHGMRRVLGMMSKMDPDKKREGPRRESPKQAKHDTCCVLTLK